MAGASHVVAYVECTEFKDEKMAKQRLLGIRL